jgi:hypothetical protein
VSPRPICIPAVTREQSHLNLVAGKRYRVTVVNPIAHPLQILSMGSSAATDTVLLDQGSGVGAWESDAGVDWQDLAGGVVEFTLTPALIAAMNAGGKTPGYRCSLHASMMRGGFVIAMPSEPILDPLPDVPKGALAIEFEALVEGLPAPLGVLDPGDDTGRLLVYDQSGLVIVIRDGQRLDPPFLDVSPRLVKLGILGRFDETDYDERGCWGWRFIPSFSQMDGFLPIRRSRPREPPIFPSREVPEKTTIRVWWRNGG